MPKGNWRGEPKDRPGRGPNQDPVKNYDDWRIIKSWDEAIDGEIVRISKSDPDNEGILEDIVSRIPPHPGTVAGEVAGKEIGRRKKRRPVVQSAEDNQRGK